MSVSNEELMAIEKVTQAYWDAVADGVVTRSEVQRLGAAVGNVLDAEEGEYVERLQRDLYEGRVKAADGGVSVTLRFIQSKPTRSQNVVKNTGLMPLVGGGSGLVFGSAAGFVLGGPAGALSLGSNAAFYGAIGGFVGGLAVGFLED